MSLPTSVPTFVLDEPLQVFISYSHQDAALLRTLVTHLTVLQRQKVIDAWTDRDISAGEEWKRAIDENLSAAHLILLLISADFLASDYCYEIEMKEALTRHAAEVACVIPIILRPSDWQASPLGQLQALPTGGKPVTRWEDQDEAFLDVIKGLRQVVTERGAQLVNRKPPLVFFKQGVHFKDMGDYDEAQRAFEAALRNFRAKHPGPHADVAECLYELGECAFHLEDFQTAGQHFKEAWQINEQVYGGNHPKVALCLQSLSAVSREQAAFAQAREYGERALQIYQEHADELSPNWASTLNNLGNIAFDQGHFAEAQNYYERALALDDAQTGSSLDPTVIPITVNNLGKAHHRRGDFAQARVLYERALRLLRDLVEADHPYIAEVKKNLAQLPTL